MAVLAEEIMTSPAISVSPQTNVAQIASLLASKHFSAVPVCNPDRTLVGIVSESDILKPFRESFRAKQDWWLGVIAEGEELPQDFLNYIRRDTRTAANIMVRQVITAEETATLPELAELMIKHAINRLPILRDGKLIGIVSRSDLVAAIAASPAVLVSAMRAAGDLGDRQLTIRELRGIIRRKIRLPFRSAHPSARLANSCMTVASAPFWSQKAMAASPGCSLAETQSSASMPRRWIQRQPRSVPS